jgi:hypothetical protein
MKQETLEEVAERLYGLADKYSKNRIGFIEGAKWQEERMYSEEELEKISKELFFTMANCDKRIIHKESDFNKWLVEQFKKK